MKRNDIFTFKAPNGVEVTAIVVHVGYPCIWGRDVRYTELICYAQNRLFIYKRKEEKNVINNLWEVATYNYDKIIVEYCTLPDYDALLDRYNDIEVAQTETTLGM